MFSFSSRPAAGAGSSGGGDLAEKVRTRRRPCVETRRRLRGTRGPHAAPRRAVRHGHTPSPLRAHSRATRNRSPPGVAGQGVEVGAAERDARAGPADQRCARPRVRAGGREEERAVGAGARLAQARGRCRRASLPPRAATQQRTPTARALRSRLPTQPHCDTLAAGSSPPPRQRQPLRSPAPLAPTHPAWPAEVQREEEKLKREIVQYAKKDPVIATMLAKNVVRVGCSSRGGRDGSLGELDCARRQLALGAESMRLAARPLRPRAPDRHPAARTHGAARAAASPPVQCCSHTIALDPHFCSPPCAPPARTATF